MVLSQQITAQIKDILQKNPQGLSITGIVNGMKINRTTAGRYLESLLASGQVEMRHFGMAKIYTLSNRVPLSAVLSISSDLILQLDSHTRIIYANEPFVGFLGTTQKDLFGKNIEYSLLVPVLDDHFESFLVKVRNGIEGIEWRGELSLRNQGITVACRIAPTLFENGQKGVSVIFEDITRQKEDERRIRKSEELYRSLAESSQDLIFVINFGDRVEYVNSYAATALQKPPEEIIGSDRSTLFPPDLSRQHGAFLRRIFSTGEILRSESEVSFPGATRWFDHVLVPIKNTDGSVRAVLGVSRDITGRRQAEAAQKESEAQSRSILSAIPDGVAITTLQGVVNRVSPVVLRIFGFLRDEEILGKPIVTFLVPEDRERAGANIALMHQGVFTGPGEYRALRADGSTLDIEVNAEFVRNAQGHPSGMVFIIRDITGRRQASGYVVKK